MVNKFDGLEDDTLITTESTDTTVDAANVENDTTSITENRVPTDPNKITVQVTSQAPIILLFGAPSSGKTMTLVRLARYLRNHKHYSVSVNQLFVTNTDVWEYAENSAKFNDMLGTTTALRGTDRNDFLLVKVCDNTGKEICQILEGAGEDYFSLTGTNRAQKSFPPYMTGVFNSNNKKIWIFLTEPNWKVNQADRDEYVQRIAYCKRNFFQKKDKSIILYNKVDTTNYVIAAGIVHTKNAMIGCNNEYSRIFDVFANKSPLPWADKYTCKFVPFSTGSYNNVAQGELAHYDLSHDAYPAKLWETIEQCIKS